MPTHVVALPDPYALDDYIWTLLMLNQAAAKGVDEIVLDFSRARRAYPDGVLPLIAALMRLRSGGISVEVRLPEDHQLRGVFDGVGWSHYLCSTVVDFLDLPPVTRKFTPARPFFNSAQLDRLRESILQVALTQGRLAEWLPEAIQWTLWEVMENVLNHSKAPMGWVQASTFVERRHINILVVDSGIGIRESLSEVFPSLSDQQAIKKAVEEGVTRNPESNAGFGLTGCRAITADNRGQMIVYSGACLMRQESVGPNKPELRRYTNTLAPHHGTLVELQLRMDRPIDLEKALGQAQPIPLIELTHDTGSEYVFDVASEASNLGTREAGRELRNKVLNLRQADPGERIVFDFGRVEVVSSSFADEFVAKLAAEMGREAFFDRFELQGMGQSVRAVLIPTLLLRLGKK